MKELGYIQGEYDFNAKTFKPLSREKSLMWSTKINNLYPFKRIVESDYLTYTLVDFCFSLDLKRDFIPVEIMMDRAKIKNNILCLDKEDFFIHLCTHLYKEAINTIDVVWGSDLNLIKFCDAREFITKQLDSNLSDKSIMFSIEHNLNYALYFVIYHLNVLYQDGYENKLLERLNITDLTFLNEYGHGILDKPQTWKKDFVARLFSKNNSDELSEMPKYLSI